MSDVPQLKTAAKPWKCAGGHVMGQVKWKGHGQSQLILFREAIDPKSLGKETLLSEPEVFAVLEGYVTATVGCSICGKIRTWVPGEEALSRLIASHKQMVQNQQVVEAE